MLARSETSYTVSTVEEARLGTDTPEPHMSHNVPGPSRGKNYSPWSRKRWYWTIAAIILGIIIVVVAIVVPVILTRRRSKTYSYEELYLPQGYNGTGLNGIIGKERPSVPSYDTLLVFGSSYSDNAHARAPQYSGSLAGTGYWQGHWSDGPIWVEYLQDMLGNVTQLNYAYGGATTNNSIHLAASPDTSQQMNWYLEHDYKRNSKPIVAMFTTTNDITATYRDFLNSASSIHNDINAALSVITQSAQSLVRQLSGLIPTDRTATAPDFLILPILPVELAPQSRDLALQAGTTTDAVRRITQQYNNVLMKGAQDIASQLGSRGSVFTYDVPAWYYSMVNDPSKYSLKNVVEGCLNDDRRCERTNYYLWWDHLHLPSHQQRKLAQLAANAILGQSVVPYA